MSNSRPCYQLHTVGDSACGWKFKMKSKAVFTSKEDAERYIPQFEELCYDETHFDHAVQGSLKTKVVTLELFE